MSQDELDFLVNRKDWHDTRFVEGGAPKDLAPGRVRFRVDRFAFTANNISYALSGDMIGYWRFFPAEEGWGRIPAMGYGDVVASTHPEVAEGTRCFGFFPMSRYLVIEPGKVTPANISDGAAHRADIAAVYNQYSPVENDPMYAADREDEMILLRGLFLTSFLCDDFLADADHYGAKSVLITSASSKTSIALGHLVSKAGRAKAVGLTSSRNFDFVKGTGVYDEVVLYDDVKSLPAGEPVVMVDMAGDAEVRSALHHHYGDNMRYSCGVGATHWENSTLSTLGGDPDLPGAKPEFFFAPGQIAKRTQEWGPQGLQNRLGSAWTDFRDSSSSWLTVKRGYGREAVEQVFRDTLDGRALPSEGHVISLWDDADRAGGR